MEIAKALILAGIPEPDRPWPVASVKPRHLFPIANRPILFHNLEALRAAGVREAAILAPAGTAGAIEDAVGDGRAWDMDVHHLEPADSGELHGALAAAYDFVAGEPVLVQQGDALLRERMHGHLTAFSRERLDALALRLGREDTRHLRKPEPGYVLSPRAIEILLERASGSALGGVRAAGGRVRVQRVDGCLPCHGGTEMLLDGNRHVLERIESYYEPTSLTECRVQGPVVVHPSARVSNTLLRGPVVIGPEAEISGSYIGPYTAIGAGAVLESAEVEHSIVLARAELRFVGTRIESSIIGEGARVGRGFDLPGALRLCLGDDAEVLLR